MDLKHRIVITRHRPGRRGLVVAGSVLALLVAGFALYRYTRASTALDFEKAASERDQLLAERRALSHELRELRSENGKLRDEVAYLKRSTEIDSVACTDVKKSLAGLTAQAADLREQLAFYRGIVSPQEAQAGVRVYDFKLLRGRVRGEYRYDLVLIQSTRSEKRVAGTVDLQVEGLRGATKQVLKLAELVPDAGRGLLFSFKYFQELGGVLRLPDGFRPLRVMVSVLPEGESTRIEDNYEWAKVEQEKVTP